MIAVLSDVGAILLVVVVVWWQLRRAKDPGGERSTRRHPDPFRGDRPPDGTAL